MTRTLTDPLVLRMLEGHTRIDAGLPPWARRTHPIVRRELGIYWKTLPLELALWTRLLLFQAGVIVLAIPFPILYSFIMPVVTVSILLMPIVFLAYAQALLNILTFAAGSILDERHNKTLPLLMVTPLTLDNVLFSKLAAAIWRQHDNLGLVMMSHVLLSLPLIVLQNASYYTRSGDTWLTALAIILSLAVGLARLFVEPVMVGSLGLMLGATTSPRIVAVIAAGGLAGMYFLMINLMRLLVLPTPWRLALEMGLPLVVPVLVSAAALAATARILRAD